jgi:hypothetical protein
MERRKGEKQRIQHVRRRLNPRTREETLTTDVTSRDGARFNLFILIAYIDKVALILSKETGSNIGGNECR